MKRYFIPNSKIETGDQQVELKEATSMTMDPLVSVGELNQSDNLIKRKEKRQKTITKHKSEKLLAEKNVHDRDSRIYIIEDKHEYWLNNKRLDISVSKFKNMFFDPFDVEDVLNKMFTWADKSGRIKSTSKSAYAGLTKDEVRQKWTDTADYGTFVHNCIEIYLENYYIFKDSIDTAEKYIRLIHPKGFNEKPVNKKYESCLKQFLEYETKLYKEGWVPYRTEWIVFDEDIGLAGSIDAVYKRDDEYKVIDWKTSSKNFYEINKFGPETCYWPLNNIRPSKMSEYSLQINIYSYILKNKYDINVTSMGIVQLDPKENYHRYFKVTDIQDKVKTMFKLYKDLKDFKKELTKWEKSGSEYSELHPTNLFPIRYEKEEEYLNI